MEQSKEAKSKGSQTQAAEILATKSAKTNGLLFVPFVATTLFDTLWQFAGARSLANKYIQSSA
jgi:hypothetical protein